MKLLGHLGIVLLGYAPIAYRQLRMGRGRRALVGTTVLALLASLPDVDLLLPGVAHRGITHTVWAALALGLVAGVVGLAVGARSRRDTPTSTGAFAFLIGAFGVVAHLFADAVTPMGIRPFAPVSDVSYSLDLVAAADPGANLGLLVVGTVACCASFGVGGHAAPAGSFPRLPLPERVSNRRAPEEVTDPRPNH